MAAELLYARATGWIALSLLGLALVASPIGLVAEAVLGERVRATASRLSPKRVARARRALGIASALFACLHATAALTGYLADAWTAVLTWPYLRAGLVALVILLALLATSFPVVVRGLRIRVWKPLHRLSYAAFGLAAVHVGLSPFAPRRVALAFFALVVVVGLARVLRTRRAKKLRAARAARARARRADAPDAPDAAVR